jgi:hypothetical protein
MCSVSAKEFPLFGQDTGGPKRFRVLGWGELTEKLFYTQSELPPPPTPDNPTPLPDPNYKEDLLSICGANRSPFYPCDPSKPLKIIKHEGSKIVLLTSLDFSKGPSLPLLLISGESGGFDKVRVIEDAQASFPGGGFMLFNFSNVPVKSEFKNETGVTDSTISPQEVKTIRPTFKDQKVTFLTVTLPNIQKLVYSSNWVLKDDHRYLIFFINDGNDPQSVHFLRVSDNINGLILPNNTPGQTP